MLIDNIYTLLPRYLKNIPPPDLQNGDSMSELVIEFELNHQSFNLTIYSAHVKDKEGNLTFIYPGHREELIEQALRKLAVPNNVNFDARSNILVFTVSQLLHYMFQISGGKHFSAAEIESGLKVLETTSYMLENYEGEFNFRPFVRMSSKKRKKEKIHLVEFIPFFFSRTNIFDFAFPNFIKGRSH